MPQNFSDNIIGPGIAEATYGGVLPALPAAIHT